MSFKKKSCVCECSKNDMNVTYAGYEWLVELQDKCLVACCKVRDLATVKYYGH